MQNSLLNLFYKMAAGAHLGCPKFTSDRISGHFRSICNFNCCEIFDLMAAVGHFGCPQFTFDRISDHFRSIRILFIFFTKWPPAPILDVRNSLSITFLAISDRYATLIYFLFFTKWPPRKIWMSEIHFRSHFRPFQIDIQLYFFGNV